jgi:hypothetical protein
MPGLAQLLNRVITAAVGELERQSGSPEEQVRSLFRYGLLALASGPAPDDAGDRLYVLSGKENALAEICFGADGKTKPPRSLPLPGRLITMAASALASSRSTPARVAASAVTR